MQLIMTGQATPAQIGGFLIGLRMKGETVDEIAAAARVMRELATPVPVSGAHLVDTCGTGGDGASTFNISTASALVAAAAGARVAKHGNRSVSSSCGSADVLEAACVMTDKRVDNIEELFDGPTLDAASERFRGGIGLQEMLLEAAWANGVRTLFNLLGPLTNPAGAPNQVLGVFSEEWLEPLARVLEKLGSQHVLVVHADDGLDEISIGSATQVAELNHGKIDRYRISPEQFGLRTADVQSLAVASAQESLALIRQVLDDIPGAARDIVLLNAGAAIYACGVAGTLEQGVEAAKRAISSAKAKQKLDELIEISNGF